MKPSLSVDVNCTKILPYLFLGGAQGPNMFRIQIVSDITFVNVWPNLAG